MKSKLFASAFFFVNFCFAFLLDTRFLNMDALLAGELEKDLVSFADRINDPIPAPEPPISLILNDPAPDPVRPEPPVIASLNDPAPDPVRPEPPISLSFNDPVAPPRPPSYLTFNDPVAPPRLPSYLSVNGTVAPHSPNPFFAVFFQVSAINS